MASIHNQVLSVEELEYLNNLPEVLAAKASLDARSSGMVYFSVTVTDSIRTAVQSRFGLELSTSSIPMRWIKGDTAPHIDRGASNFQNTYLMYLNDSPGEFIVDSRGYPIEANTGFVFSEGLSHETQGTGNAARLLLGPMNEFAQPVGAGFVIYYYATEADALTYTNFLGYSSSYEIGSAPFDSSLGNTWRIASNSTGSDLLLQEGNINSNPEFMFFNGDPLFNDGVYYLYRYSIPPPPLFINYYATKADALAGTNRLAQGSSVIGYEYPGFQLAIYFGYAYWKVASNSTGSASQVTLYSNNDELPSDGDYYVYAINGYIAYYATEADAIANSNSLGGSTITDPLIVGADGPYGGFTSWRIASSSTGSASQAVVYSNGDPLDNDGVYFMYPAVVSYIKYYPTEADALANSNSLGQGPSTSSLVVGAGGSYGGFTSWRIASSSTGSSSQATAYSNASELLADGIYYAYPAVVSYIKYYATEANALANSNSLGQGPSTNPLVVGADGPYGGFTSWRIASSSTGSSSQATVYSNTSELLADGIYYAYPAAPCFLEGSMILCQVDGVDKYVPVEELKNGVLVKTTFDGYKAVVLIGKGSIKNAGNDERTENRLYKCSPSKYPELKEDLYITGCHSILEDNITDKQREDTIKHLSRVFATDNKYRLMACIDERAEPWNSEGVYTIWHFALENADDGMNYGVYANGLLVETCSIRALKKKSNMTLSS